MVLFWYFPPPSKVLRPEKLAAHLFEVDEDVEKDEVGTAVPECFAALPRVVELMGLKSCGLEFHRRVPSGHLGTNFATPEN